MTTVCVGFDSIKAQAWSFFWGVCFLLNTTLTLLCPAQSAISRTLLSWAGQNSVNMDLLLDLFSRSGWHQRWPAQRVYVYSSAGSLVVKRWRSLAKCYRLSKYRKHLFKLLKYEIKMSFTETLIVAFGFCATRMCLLSILTLIVYICWSAWHRVHVWLWAVWTARTQLLTERTPASARRRALGGKSHQDCMWKVHPT